MMLQETRDTPHLRTDPGSTLGIPTAHVDPEHQPLTVVKELYR